MNPIPGKFSGVLPAIVTPVDAEERFAAKPFERLIERFYECGAHGLYVCGQTGEGWTQPVAQRKLVTEAAVRNSPAGKQVIVHVGAQSTEDAMELAKHASKAGAQAISSLPPAGGYTFEEIREYYRAIAGASDVPLLVYYFPSLAASIRTLDQILELCELPNVAGLKFTDMDLYRVSLIKGTGATVFNGADEIFAAGMLMGADGGIGSTYNVIPASYVEIFECARRGDWERARSLQMPVNELIHVLLQFPLLAAIKKLLGWSGIECGPAIRPKRGLTAEEESRLRTMVSKTELGSRMELHKVAGVQG